MKEPVDIAEILSQPIWDNYFLQKQDSTLVLPRALQKRGLMHKGHSRRERKIPYLVFSKGKVWIAKSTFMSWLKTTD